MVLAFIRVVRRTELENLCSHMRSKKRSTKLFIVSFIINRNETELLSSALQIRPILGDLASRIEDSGIRTSRTANKKKGCAGRQTSKRAKASLQRKHLTSYVLQQPIQSAVRIIIQQAADNSGSAGICGCLKDISKGRSTARDNTFIRLMRPIDKHLHCKS